MKETVTHFSNPDLVRVSTGWQVSSDRLDAGLDVRFPLPTGNSRTSTLMAQPEPQCYGYAARPRTFGCTAQGPQGGVRELTRVGSSNLSEDHCSQNMLV